MGRRASAFVVAVSVLRYKSCGIGGVRTLGDCMPAVATACMQRQPACFFVRGMTTGKGAAVLLDDWSASDPGRICGRNGSNCRVDAGDCGYSTCWGSRVVGVGPGYHGRSALANGLDARECECGGPQCGGHMPARVVALLHGLSVL